MGLFLFNDTMFSITDIRCHERHNIFDHYKKTKVMRNKHVNKDDVIVDGKKIEEVDGFVSLEQMVTKDHDQVQEMKTSHCSLHKSVHCEEI